MLHRTFDEGDVDREVAQRFDDPLGVRHLELQAAVRLGGEECGQPFRQQVAADGGAGANPQVTGELLLEQGFHLLRALQCGLRMRVETAAVLVEHQTLAMAIEQSGAELMLQVLQRHARGRLGQAQLLAGTGHAAKVGNGDEGGELAEGDSALHISIPDMSDKNKWLRSGYMPRQACATTSEVSPC
ncbi:hypothetical protein D3C76_1351770 [compost metagenome]